MTHTQARSTEFDRLLDGALIMVGAGLALAVVSFALWPDGPVTRLVFATLGVFLFPGSSPLLQFVLVMPIMAAVCGVVRRIKRGSAARPTRDETQRGVPLADQLAIEQPADPLT